MSSQLTFLFFLFRAILAAYGSSWGPEVKSELQLQPTPKLVATPDPYPTERGQVLNLHPFGHCVGWTVCWVLNPLSHSGNSSTANILVTATTLWALTESWALHREESCPEQRLLMCADWNSHWSSLVMCASTGCKISPALRFLICGWGPTGVPILLRDQKS